MNHSDFVVMLARPRSGTNAVRSVLATHADIFCLDEVFAISERTSEHEISRRANFFNFLVEYAAGDVERIFPDRTEQVFNDFLDYLRALSTKKFVVFDVKYTTLHLLTAPFAFGRPLLLDLLVASNMHVLNVRRANYLRYYLSQQKAMATGHWETELRDKPVDDAIAVNVPELMWTLELCEREDRMIRDRFVDYGSFYSCEYIDAFPDTSGSVSPQILGEIASWLDIENRFTNQADIRKQSYLPLRETIRNYDEVSAALRLTRFSSLLADEPIYRSK